MASRKAEVICDLLFFFSLLAGLYSLFSHNHEYSLYSTLINAAIGSRKAFVNLVYPELEHKKYD